METMSLNISQQYKIKVRDKSGEVASDRLKEKKNEKRVKSIPHNPSHQF